MKLVFPLTALTFFLLLSYLTYPAKRDETLQIQEKQDFFFKDIIHDTTIAGSWIDEDYVVKMQIKHIILDMKLVFECTQYKDSADVDSTPNGNRTSNSGKIDKGEDYFRDAICPVYKPFRPRLPDVIEPRSWCYYMTVKMTSKIWNGFVWIAKWIWNNVTWMGNSMWTGVTRMGGSMWNSVTWMGESMWIGVTWMGKSMWNGGTWMGRSIWNGVILTSDSMWNGVTWMGKLMWNGVTWMGKSMWTGVTWMAEKIWNGISWIGKLFIPAFNYVTDAVVEFYDEYLDDHVRPIQARIVILTWKDVCYTMLGVFVVNVTLYVAYLFITGTVNFIRRKWQARKDRIAAANLPPKKPIWRPKPKKKRRKNKNDW